MAADGLYFGLDLQHDMQLWFEGSFEIELRSRYGKDCAVAGVILDPAPVVAHDWHDPLANMAVYLKAGI